MFTTGENKLMGDILDTKKCGICKQNKPVSEFYRSSTSKDGYQWECKECKSADAKKWKKENPEKLREQFRKYRIANIERRRENNRRWRKNNPEKAKAAWTRGIIKERSTLKGRLSNRISTDIRTALHKNKKGRSWESLVGYTFEQLKRHLEKQFNPGMTWENYGSHWHIDHKIPKSAFNYEKAEDIDFKRCWSLKNLQPMWAKDNLSKQNKVSNPFQPSLKIAI